MKKIGYLLPVMLSALLFAACTPLPQQQIDAFVESTASASNAGRQIYVELDRSVKSAQSTTTSTSPCKLRNGNASCFDPNLYIPAEAAVFPPEIEARLLALDVVNAYSASLLAIASGATQAEVKERIDQYADVTGKAASLIGGSTGATAAKILGGPAIAALKQLAGQIESIRGTAVARSTIVTQQDTVDALIDALIKDTSSTFDLYSSAQGKIASRVGSPLKQEFLEEQAKIGKFHLTLQKYVELLVQTKISQSALVDAIVEPTGFLSSIDVALDQAIALRSASEDFKKALDNLQD